MNAAIRSKSWLRISLNDLWRVSLTDASRLSPYHDASKFQLSQKRTTESAPASAFLDTPVSLSNVLTVLKCANVCWAWNKGCKLDTILSKQFPADRESYACEYGTPESFQFTDFCRLLLVDKMPAIKRHLVQSGKRLKIAGKGVVEAGALTVLFAAYGVERAVTHAVGVLRCLGDRIPDVDEQVREVPLNSEDLIPCNLSPPRRCSRPGRFEGQCDLE